MTVIRPRTFVTAWPLNLPVDLWRDEALADHRQAATAGRIPVPRLKDRTGLARIELDGPTRLDVLLVARTDAYLVDRLGDPLETVGCSEALPFLPADVVARERGAGERAARHAAVACLSGRLAADDLAALLRTSERTVVRSLRVTRAAS